MEALAVLAERLAVIAHHDDPALLGADARLERFDQPAELGVHGGDLGQVRRVGRGAEARAVRLRRLVRLVRVVVVHPEEERPAILAREVVESARGGRGRRALVGAGIELVVVDLEPALEAELAVERKTRDERGGRPPGGTQPLGGQLDAPVVAAAVLVHAVARPGRARSASRRATAGSAARWRRPA